MALEAILWISRGSRDELNAIESNNSTVTAGMARVDGFADSITLLQFIRADNPAVDTCACRSASRFTPRRQDFSFSPGFRFVDGAPGGSGLYHRCRCYSKSIA